MLDPLSYKLARAIMDDRIRDADNRRRAFTRRLRRSRSRALRPASRRAPSGTPSAPAPR